MTSKNVSIRTVRVVSAPREQLAWLRCPRTDESWGSGRVNAPLGFDPKKAADQIEASVRVTHHEEPERSPLLVCSGCHGWTRHSPVRDHAVTDSDGRVMAVIHRFSCDECEMVRDWGCSAPSSAAMGRAA